MPITRHNNGEMSARLGPTAWRIILRSLDNLPTETIVADFGEIAAERITAFSNELARELRK